MRSHLIYAIAAGCMSTCLRPAYAAGSADGGYVKPALTLDAQVVSPEAKPWGFPLYDTPQVNPATGTGSLSVGLFSWSVGGFPVSVALGHSLGARTYDEKSGAVGLGWTLDCEGAVWRDIVGLPDEYKSFKSLSVEEIGAMDSSGSGLNYLDAVHRKNTDAMYDRYHYRFPGYSGSFIIKDGSIISLPASDVSITRIGDAGNDKVKDFQIATPDGAVYEFTVRERTSYTYKSGAPQGGSPSYDASVSKWHLSRIITPEGADTITYSYAELPMWGTGKGQSSGGVGVQCIDGRYSYTSLNSGMLNATSTVQTLNGRLLSGVSSRTATIKFSHAASIGEGGSPRCISGMTVYAPDNSEVRKVEFSYGKLTDGRRVLKAVKVMSGSETIDTHEFTYFSFSGGEPGDFFGYCNGYASAGERSVIDPNTGRFNQARRYNALYAANGAMKSHSTMAGAKTIFEYEPNTLVIESLGDSVQIGVRIKSITTTDMVANRKQTRRYSYSRPVCSIDFTQVGITPFVSLSGLSWVEGSGIQQREGHNLSAATLRSSRLPGTPLSSARIFYGEAVEEVSGTGIDRPVRTEYEYDTSGCTLRRVGGSGDAQTGNSLYIKSDMTMPSPRRENADRLFNAGFANYYFAECNYAEPRLKVRRQMQWENDAYHPLEQKEYHYSLVDSAAYYTGLNVEPLVKDFKDQFGTTKAAYDNIKDFVYMQTAMLSGRWRLDSVAEKRWYGTGADAIVAKSGTGYRYTTRKSWVWGDNVAWAVPKLPLIPIPDVYPDIPVGKPRGSKVFGDSVSDSSVYEMLIGTVTHTAGHTLEHHTAWSGCVPGRGYSVKTLPVAEMWIVDGRDSLLKRYEYGKFRSLTRPTRISLGLKGMPAMAEQRFTAYTPHGHPTVCLSLGQPEQRYSYDGDLLIMVSTGPGDDALNTRFSHIPLVGVSSVTSPAGYVERFGYEDGRLAWRKAGPQQTLMDKWAYSYSTGYGSVNSIAHTSYAAGTPAESVECFDGFGTAIGTVSRGFGSDGDVLTLRRLDALGRVTEQWSPLPVADEASVLCSGNGPGTAAMDFYGDRRAYAGSVYPCSAEGEPVESTLAGSVHESHPARMESVCSDPSKDELKVWRLHWDGSTLRCAGRYGAGELQGRRVTDADGVTVTTLSDALGCEVLRRAEGDGSVMADTYTVCDAWGNPLIVVQPQGAALLHDGGSWSAGQPLIDEYSFIYRYDDRLRPVSAKIPGCAPELTAYDSRGLVAYTRDGRLAATGRKMFHLYDAHCRPAVSGICEDFLSDSDWGRVHDTPVLQRAKLSAGVASDYSISPSSLPTGAQVTQWRYYDRYLPGMEYSHGVNSPLGLPTAERTLILDGWKTTADTVTVEHHYDSMMHEMFTRRKHSDGTTLLCTTTRTPGGLPLVESIALSGPLGSHSLTTYTEYDAFGRITSLKANGDMSGVLTLAQNSYDGVGRLASSTVQGGTETTYGYDVRGVLTSADNPFIKQAWNYASGSSSPSYAGRISAKSVTYHDNGGSCSGSVTYRYDSMGRLKETVAKRDFLWMMNPPVVDPPVWKAGAFEIDTTNTRPLNPGGILRKKRDYSESFTYDLNSNILSLTRMGSDGKGQYVNVDDVTMGYTGNRLTLLNDNADEVTLESSMDIPSGRFSGRDFGYDAAGAVTRDLSRNIANIDYYFNGMPNLIGSMDGDCISYIYTADGEKLAETVWNGNRTTRRDYIGPFEFVGGRLLRTNLPQGYIDSIGTLHAYIPDIQGNIVGVHEARENNTKLEQLNEYYAYGGLTADSDGQDANRRKHTAKELTTDLGINTYDFTARRHSPMAARFNQPDRLSDVNPWDSPYAFCGGDPINRTDPTGKNAIRIVDNENKTVTVRAVYYVSKSSQIYREQGEAKSFQGYSEADIANMAEINSYLNELNLQVKKGKFNGYTINFDLSIIGVSTPEKAREKAESTATNDGDNYGNTIHSGNQQSEERLGLFVPTINTDGTWSVVGGRTIDYSSIIMNDDIKSTKNLIHEIFHTFGLEHPIGGASNGIHHYPPLTPNNNDAYKIMRTKIIPLRYK